MISPTANGSVKTTWNEGSDPGIWVVLHSPQHSSRCVHAIGSSRATTVGGRIGRTAPRRSKAHGATPQQTVTTRHRAGAERRTVSGWPSIPEPLRSIIDGSAILDARSRAARGERQLRHNVARDAAAQLRSGISILIQGPFPTSLSGNRLPQPASANDAFAE
jgi:hypothetical protein